MSSVAGGPPSKMPHAARSRRPARCPARGRPRRPARPTHAGRSCRWRCRPTALRAAAEASLGFIRIGRAQISPAASRASSTSGQVERLEVQHLLERLDHLGHVHARRRRGPARAGRSARPGPACARSPSDAVSSRTSSPIAPKKRALLVGGGLELLRGELLQPLEIGLGLVLDLRGDAHVAGVELAAAADRASQRDHRQRAEAHAVGAQAVQLHDVPGVAVAAVGPDLDAVADARLHQRQVHRARADVRRQPHVAQRVRARRAGAALEAARA